MSLEDGDERRGNSRTRRLSSSSIMSEEEKSNSGFLESLGDCLRPPGTAVIRRTETRSIKTNQTTGLKVAEQFTKNLSMMSSVRQQLVTQKECLKLESARPITSRGQRDRNFHGIRHFQGVLHSKIRDLALEIEKLHWRCNSAQQEYINSATYETKAKELASEITNFQESLTDLNLAFDYVNRIGDIEKVEQEVRQIEKLNISEKGSIEELFDERKLKEDFVHQIENNERVKKIINSSHPDATEGKEQYIYFNNRLSQSKKGIGFWEKQIEQYKKVKDLLTEKLKIKVPFIEDIIFLEIKLSNLKRKMNEVSENSALKLNKEREIILETVKLDKSEITGMECHLRSLTKQIDNLQDVIDHLKSEGEMFYTKETIDVYLSSFDNNKDNEIKKMNSLESGIMHNLSDFKIKLSLIPTVNDYLNLEDNKIGEADISDSMDFQEKHRKAFNSLKKLELMNFYQTKDFKNIYEKCNKLKDDLEEYKSQKKMNDKFGTQENKLTNQISQLEEHKTTHLRKLEMAKTQLGRLEKEILENEKHNELLALEKKHSSLEEDIMLMNQTITEMKTATHLLEIRTKTLNLMGSVNSELINHYA